MRIGYLIGLLVLPVVLYAIPLERITHGEHSICLFRAVFGTECYGCGTTRSLFSLLHLRLAQAWEYNHLVVVIAPLLLYLYVKELVKTAKRL